MAMGAIGVLVKLIAMAVQMLPNITTAKLIAAPPKEGPRPGLILRIVQLPRCRKI